MFGFEKKKEEEPWYEKEIHILCGKCKIVSHIKAGNLPGASDDKGDTYYCRECGGVARYLFCKGDY